MPPRLVWFLQASIVDVEMNSELVKIANVYGDVCIRRKKQRRKRQKLLMTELMTDYAKNSTLHGLRYIVDNALNIFERLFWFLTVIGSLALCSFYIYNVVLKWKTSPVIVSVNGRLASVGSVPFPAVTICPQVKVNPLAYNYSENLALFLNRSLPGKSKAYLKFAHINSGCDSFDNQNIMKKGIFDNVSYIEDLIMATPQMNDIFLICDWQPDSVNESETESCTKMFSRVITSEGICYTTNGLSQEDIFKDSIQKDYNYTNSDTPQHGWSMESGYNYTSSYFYPKRGRVSTFDADLTIILKINPELVDKECNKLYSGYKIFLHHPADMPQSTQYYYAAIPNQLSSVAISFHEFDSESGLANYDSNIRQCYFPNDRKLRYFKTYTTKNCRAECLSNYTYHKCGCVGFYMPFHNSSEICYPNIYNLACLHKAQDFMAKQERQLDLGLITSGCNCLPACNTVEYDAEILKTEFRFDLIVKKYVDYFKLPPINITYSGINLYYKQSQFVTMQRRELFGFTDLLANIGGLLGLFLGFSFLSLVEIIYFLTFRVGLILKRDLEEEKKKEKLKSNMSLVK